jgi:SAM-dependent methyltransferase
VTRDVRRLNRERFTETAPRYAASPVARRPAQFEALVRLAAPAPGDSVLDVACGPGVFLASLAGTVRRAVGVDLTPAMLQEARRRAGQAPGLHLVQGEAERLPFRDGVFTLAVTTWALHHVAEPERVLAEMARVVAPGGRVAVGDLVGDEDEATRARQNALERMRDPAHVAVLSRSQLRGMLARCGLRVTGEARGAMERDFDEWCRIAATPEGVARRVRDMLVATIPGDLAGLSPAVHGERVTFRHRWAVVVAARPPLPAG